jgi:zinc transport system substrate-binding protein/iron/zinc/copper transport system substrate-binding protein
MKKRIKGKMLVGMVLTTTLVLSACGNANEGTESNKETGSPQLAAGQTQQAATDHENQKNGSELHGQQAGNNHGANGGGQHGQAASGQHGGNHTPGGQQASSHPNKPVRLSEVQGVVASTSLTALIAEAAGASEVRYIAPSELRHPPEYDYRPSDISKVKDSYLVYLGYEPFMAKLMEGAKISPDMAATIEVDNTPDGYKKATKKLADIWGTQDQQAKFEAEMDQLAQEIVRWAGEHKVSGQKVVSQIYMTPLLKWLGYEIVGEFGPNEVPPSQLADLAKLEPDLIVDNLHMPLGAGFSEISKETKRIELRSYPDPNMKSLLDILRHNAKQLGIIRE